MDLSRRHILSAIVAAAALPFALAGPAWAYPDKPVTYIIPFGPGGESDITARFQQPFFLDKFGQNFVITYKPGGGGAVAWAQLNSMPGDGYTIMGVNLPHIIVKPMQKDVGFKTEDLTTVHMFHYTPDAIVVKADSPFKTLQDLIDAAKAEPGKITMSGSGKGTANHIAQVLFDDMAGIKTTYVPFKGTGAAVTALLGDQVRAEWGYTTVPANYENTRMLAVAMENRHPKFPDVPTFKELGFDLVSGAYRGVAVPKSTPEELRQQISTMIQEINDDPEFKKKMEDGGFVVTDITYDKIPAFMAEQTVVFEKAAKLGGLVE
jgi:tripartite-type tricarboxylate transporter receptor subunit TctC